MNDKQNIYNYMGISNKWIGRIYSSLKHFEFVSKRPAEQVFVFLKNNSQIRSFSTTIEFLRENRNYVTKYLTQRNFTVLYISHDDTDMNVNRFEEFRYTLGQLENLLNFEKLKLFFFTNTRKQYTLPSNVLYSLKILHLTNADNQKVPVALDSLERLYIRNITQFTNLTVTLDHLNNLQFIYFTKESIENILPFIRLLTNIKEIEIYEIAGNGDYYNNDAGILNLPILNEERGICQGGGTIKFYVNEMNYVATRMKYKRKTFQLIEFSRLDTHDDMDHFGWH